MIAQTKSLFDALPVIPVQVAIEDRNELLQGHALPEDVLEHCFSSAQRALIGSTVRRAAICRHRVPRASGLRAPDLTRIEIMTVLTRVGDGLPPLHD